MFIFNPEPDQINRFISLFYPKLKLIFPETLIEKKIGSFIFENSNIFKKYNTKCYFSVGNSEPHYGNYLTITDDGADYSFINN